MQQVYTRQMLGTINAKDIQSWVEVDYSVRYSHGGDVLSRKGIGGVADEQAGLTHSSAREEMDKTP